MLHREDTGERFEDQSRRLLNDLPFVFSKDALFVYLVALEMVMGWL